MRKLIMLVVVALMLGGCAGVSGQDVANTILDIVSPEDWYR